MQNEQAAEILREIDSPTPVTTEEEEKQPPAKKQKISDSREENEKENQEFSLEEKAKRKRLLHQITILINSHPEMNLIHSEEDEYLKSLPTIHLQQVLDTALLKSGATDIYTIPSMILFGIAKALHYQLGLKDLTARFSSDIRLQNMIQEWFPADHWSVGPLEIAHRIYHHIEKEAIVKSTVPEYAGVE